MYQKVQRVFWDKTFIPAISCAYAGHYKISCKILHYWGDNNYLSERQGMSCRVCKLFMTTPEGDGYISNGWGRICTRPGDSGLRAARVEVRAAWPWDVGECAPYPRYEGIIMGSHGVCQNDRLGNDGLENSCRTWGRWRGFSNRVRVVRGFWIVRLT